MRYLPLVLILTMVIGSRAAVAEIEEIWTTHDGQKVRPTDPGPGVVEPVSLFGMRNETIAFQLVIRADTMGARNVQVSLTDLVLPSDVSETTTPHVEIFRVDYVEVRERSHDLFWKPGSSAEPAHYLGLVPDRLAPARTGVDIAPGENQVFWIDVWSPPMTPPGLRSGKVRITDDGACSSGCQLDVTLDLIEATMPETPRIRTMLWFSGGEPEEKYVYTRYFADPQSASDAEKRQLRLRHYQLARRHRISLFWEYHDIQSDELDALLSGRAFSSEAGYVGPGQDKGQNLLVLRTYSGEMSLALASAWNAFSQNYPDILDTFFYTMDEPEESDYPEVSRRAATSGSLKSFVTTTYSSELDVDIFAAPANIFTRADVELARLRDKTMWIYNGVRPFSGSFAIDDVAISPRVNPWIQYKEDIGRWFYWESNYYFDFQGKRGAVDVGREAANFTNRHGDVLNGDGLLMYPGRDFLFPGSDLGEEGPVASIRLKNWRRGIEDVEYLVMARAAGHDAQVDALLAALLPHSLDSVGESAAVSWPEDGERWLLARRYLYELIRDGETEIDLAQIRRSENVRVSSPKMKVLPLLLGGLFALLAALLFQYWQRMRS